MRRLQAGCSLKRRIVILVIQSLTVKVSVSIVNAIHRSRLSSALAHIINICFGIVVD